MQQSVTSTNLLNNCQLLIKIFFRKKADLRPYKEYFLDHSRFTFELFLKITPKHDLAKVNFITPLVQKLTIITLQLVVGQYFKPTRNDIENCLP